MSIIEIRINIMEKCVKCSEKAIKKCLCSNQVFCKKHAGKHAISSGDHHLIEIISEVYNDNVPSHLSDSDLTHVKNELRSRIKKLKECKQKILSHTSFLISQIESLSFHALASLFSLSQSYQTLLQTPPSSLLRHPEAPSFLSTSFSLLSNPSFETLSTIPSYFSQPFYRLLPKSNLNPFLKSHTGAIFCIAASFDQLTFYTGGDDRSIKQWSLSSKAILDIAEGHTNTVRSLSLGSDSVFLVSGSDDRTVRVWRTADLQQVAVLKGHTGRVLSVSLSSDNGRVASGASDGTICVWSLAEQRLQQKLVAHNNWVTFVSLNTDRLLSASHDKSFIEWDVRSWTQKKVVKIREAVLCVDWENSMEKVVAGLSSGKIQVWINGEMRIELSGHMNYVSAVLFASKGNRVISASADETVRIWSLKQGCQILSFTNHSSFVNCLSRFSDDLFISGSSDFSMILWNTSTLTIKSVISSQPVDFCESLLEENRLIYPSGALVRVWNLDRRCLEAEFRGHSGIVYCVAFSSGLIASGSMDSTVRVWNLRNKTQSSTFIGHQNTVFGVAMCGNIVVSGSGDKTVRIWNARKNRAKGVLNGHSDGVRSVAIAESGEILVSGSFDKTVKVWSVGKMQILHTLIGHEERILQVGLTKDDKFVVSGSDMEETVRVWDVKSGSQSFVLKQIEEGEQWLANYPEVRRLAERFI
jgi:WD40 repeat protein